MLTGSSRACPTGHKIINGGVRTFNTSVSCEKSFSPLIKTLTLSGSIIGAGYILNNSGKSVESTDIKKNDEDMHPVVKKYLKEVYGYTLFNVGLAGLTSYFAVKIGFTEKILKLNASKNVLLLESGSLLMFILTYVLDINKENHAKHASLIMSNILNGLLYSCYYKLHKFPITRKQRALHTLSIFAALSYVSITSKKDKDMWINYLFYIGMPVSLLTYLIYGSIQYTKKVSYINKFSPSIFFGLYLLYDTKNMIRGAEKYKEQLENIGGEKIIKKPDYINDSMFLNIFLNGFYRNV